MKKIVKMSLVAAVAVAGLTTANAKPLEEAIKNVDVSGTVVYRYDDRSFDDDARTDEGAITDKDRDLANNKYKIGMNLKAKANDDVTVNTRFLVGTDDTMDFASFDTIGGGDGSANVSLSQVYFGYTGIANTTVNVGKQGLTTPWTVAEDADGNEQTGTGILALTTVGPVTVAAAYFNQTNLNRSSDSSVFGSEIVYDTPQGGTNTLSRGDTSDTKVTTVLEGDDNVITVGAMANIGPVALDAWYFDMQDSFDTYTIGAMSKFDLDAVKLSVGARHTQLDFDKKVYNGLIEDISKEDNSLTKIMLGAKMGIFGLNVNYGWTDKEGGLVALDNDATTGMQGYTVQLNGVADAEYLQVKADVQALENLNISLNYHKLDKDKLKDSNDVVIREDGSETELYLQASYQMSKNFGGYIRFGQADIENDYVDASGDVEDNKGTIGRLQVQYSF